MKLITKNRLIEIIISKKNVRNNINNDIEEGNYNNPLHNSYTLKSSFPSNEFSKLFPNAVLSGSRAFMLAIEEESDYDYFFTSNKEYEKAEMWLKNNSQISCEVLLGNYLHLGTTAIGKYIFINNFGDRIIIQISLVSKLLQLEEARFHSLLKKVLTHHQPISSLEEYLTKDAYTLLVDCYLTYTSISIGLMDSPIKGIKVELKNRGYTDIKSSIHNYNCVSQKNWNLYDVTRQICQILRIDSKENK